MTTDVRLSPRRPVFRLAPGEGLIAIAVLAFAIGVFFQTKAIPVSPLYARVGPTVAPMLTFVGLFGLGLGLLRAAMRGGWQPADEKDTPVDLPAFGLVVAGLLANVLLIGPLGFTTASVVLFVLVARGFGSRAYLRNTGIALALALTAYFGFAGALGINIGRGPLESLIISATGFGKA